MSGTFLSPDLQIKMKEASRAKAAMTRNHETEKKMIML